MEWTLGTRGAKLRTSDHSFLRAYRVPLAITEQRRVRDFCPALPKIEHEVEAAPVQLERGVVNLVLMSHVVNQATGGERSDA